MEKFEISALLKEIIVSELKVDERAVTPEADFMKDLGADSLDAVHLIMKIEDRFGIEIPDEDAEEIKKVEQAEAYLVARLAEKRQPEYME
jgi:acyl carrier protein